MKTEAMLLIHILIIIEFLPTALRRRNHPDADRIIMRGHHKMRRRQRHLNLLTSRRDIGIIRGSRRLCRVLVGIYHHLRGIITFLMLILLQVIIRILIMLPWTWRLTRSRSRSRRAIWLIMDPLLPWLLLRLLSALLTPIHLALRFRTMTSHTIHPEEVITTLPV